MGQKAAGTCYVKVDGEQLVVNGAVEAPLGKFKRDTIVKGYFKEEENIPFLKGDFVGVGQTDWQKIANATNATVTVEFANGKVYTLSGAYLIGDTNYSSEDGKVSLEWNGIEGDWS